MNCVINSVGDHEENYDVLLVTNMIVVMDHFDYLEGNRSLFLFVFFSLIIKDKLKDCGAG